MTSKMNQWNQEHGTEGKSEDAGEMLDRIVQHRLRTIGDPHAAKMLQICKDWQPVSGVSSTVADAVRSLVVWLEGWSTAQIRPPRGSPDSTNVSPKTKRQSELSKATPTSPQYSARTAEQNEDAIELFRSFVLAKLCEHFHQFLTGGGQPQAATKAAAAPDTWKLLLENAELLNWICSRHRVPCNLKKFCEDRRIIEALANLLWQSPDASCLSVLPLLDALRTFVCTKEATEDLRSQRTLDLTKSGIFSLLNSQLSLWIDSALDMNNGVQQADHLLSCIGDLVREMLRRQSGCDAADNGDFVPTLHKVITDRLLAEPFLWPRASMLLMDAIEAIPKADHVQCGLDLSKSLRGMRSMIPSRDVSAIPSLLVLRLGDLRRTRQSKERQSLLRQRLGKSQSCSRRPELPSRRSFSEGRKSVSSPPLTPRLPPITTTRSSSANARRSVVASFVVQ